MHLLGAMVILFRFKPKFPRTMFVWNLGDTKIIDVMARNVLL